MHPIKFTMQVISSSYKNICLIRIYPAFFVLIRVQMPSRFIFENAVFFTLFTLLKRRLTKKADGDVHPSALKNRSDHSFPNTGGGAVSGGARSPASMARML
jgi:hypothetical protein